MQSVQPPIPAREGVAVDAANVSGELDLEQVVEAEGCSQGARDARARTGDRISFITRSGLPRGSAAMTGLVQLPALRRWSERWKRRTAGLGTEELPASASLGAKMILPLLASRSPQEFVVGRDGRADVHQGEAVVGRVKYTHAIRGIGRKDDLAVARSRSPREILTSVEMVELMSTEGEAVVGPGQIHPRHPPV